MNFSQFLTENPEIPHVKQIKPQTPTPPPPSIQTPSTPPKKVITRSNATKKSKEIHQNKNQETVENTHEEFKKGDFIVITRMENSSLNVYKGYYGEIKEIVRNGETVLVILEAMVYPKPIRFPMGHFKRRIFHR